MAAPGLTIAGVRFLSTDGSELEIRLEESCPPQVVTEVEVTETTDTVDVRVFGAAPTSEPQPSYCTQEIVRPPVVEHITLDEPLGNRAVRPNGNEIRWSVPRGQVMVLAALSAAPDALGIAIDSNYGISFAHEGQCRLVWPWQATELLRFPVPGALWPGGTIATFLAPMANPSPGVVEACPLPPEDAAQVQLPVPHDPAAVPTGVIVHLQSSLISETGTIDPTRIQIDWQLP